MIVFYRSSRSEVFCKKGALKNFAKFTRKHPCQRPFLNKVAGLQGRRQRQTHTRTLFCVAKRKKKSKGRKKEFQYRNYYKTVTKFKMLLFQPFQSVQNSKIFLAGQQWWPTILFSVLWPLHFEMHFVGPGLKPSTLLKKRHRHRRFPVNFANFLRAQIFIEHLRWVLLLLSISCQQFNSF